MTKVFIGGSIKITKLNKDVKSRIENIQEKGYTVLVGDANGVDKAVQKFLSEKGYRNTVVFCMGGECRNNIGQWETKHIETNRNKRGFDYYSVKDTEMAKEADYGFMVWDGASKGTLNNIINLLRERKKVLVYLSPDKHFYRLGSFDHLEQLLTKCGPAMREFAAKEIETSKARQTPQQALDFTQQASKRMYTLLWHNKWETTDDVRTISDMAKSFEESAAKLRAMQDAGVLLGSIKGSCASFVTTDPGVAEKFGFRKADIEDDSDFEESNSKD